MLSPFATNFPPPPPPPFPAIFCVGDGLEVKVYAKGQKKALGAVTLDMAGRSSAIRSAWVPVDGRMAVLMQAAVHGSFAGAGSKYPAFNAQLGPPCVLCVWCRHPGMRGCSAA